MLDKYYQPDLVEEKIYKKWEEDGDFRAPLNSDNKPYSIVIPPPNVTGNLHMGHALNNTLQDILVRFYRLQGRDVLWQPGTDHAGIATEMVVERELKKENKEKNSLTREEFIERVWKWKDLSGNKIINQLKRLGCSCDWSRERFTLDEGLSIAVRHVFVNLYKDGLIYKDKRLSNWDPKLKTTISDLEVIQKEVTGSLWYIDYDIEDEDTQITIATTRPETMLGDTAIAVHPDDKRYSALIGKFAILPIVEKKIPIVADKYVKMDQGSGAVKITPAHDFNDYELGRRHNLEIINIFNESAELNENCPIEYQGLNRYIAREKIINELREKEILSKVEENIHTIPYGDRSGEVIEPLLTDQWFVDAKKLSIEAIKNVKNGNTKFVPDNWDRVYFDWMENIQPWCVSRQLIWGHQIPAWYGPDGNIFVEKTAEDAQISANNFYGKDVELTQEKDVLDTWFSSALWPFSTLGWPNHTDEYKKYYPTTALITGFDIIFFWVARMMMMGIYFTKKVPFSEVYVHALVRDEKGQKMSKSKGNVIDPLVLMDEFGADALRMALCSMAAQGRDIKLSKQRIEGYKNFINKIWNAVKLCELNKCKYVEINFNKPNNIFNKWILSEYENCRKKTQLAFENYRFNEAANELYKFTWNIFCDWYLEFSKVIYLSKNDAEIKETRNTTSFVLSNILIMFHPIMPFFTEHLWHQASNILNNNTLKISKSEWPKTISVDENENKKIDLLIKLVSSIRATRSEMNVPANALIEVNFSDITDDLAIIFSEYEEIIKNFTRSKSIRKKYFSKGEGMVQVILNDGLIYLSLKGIIDFEQEKKRLEKSLSKINKEMHRIKEKLESKNFVDNAPIEIINEQKNRRTEYMISKEKIEMAIKSLG